MARSLYAKLHALYGPRRPAVELFELSAPRRQELYGAHLLPGALPDAALAGCEGLPATRVAVVGGGFAGLTAAWYLSECGVPVTVFEATGRLGGRVRSDHDLVHGKVVEAGAELIGANHPMWTELAEIFGLELVEISSEEDYERAGLAVRLRFGDRDLSDAEKKQLRTDLEPIIDAIGRDAKGIDRVRPWISPNADAFDRISVAERLNDLFGGVWSLPRTAIEFMLGNDNCAPVANQSYLGLLALVSAGRMGDDTEGMRGYWECTETHRCGGGNQQLAARLAAGLPDVRLNAPVTDIVITNGGIGITWAGQAGGEEAFDYAVLAAPPFSWPTVQSSYGWEPGEYTMAHGPAVKFLSAFDTRFWLDNGLAPSALWNRLGSVWEGTDRQPDNRGGFDLSVYSGGEHVLAGADYPDRLRAIFPGYAPRATRFVDWPNTPYIRTGYSVPAPRQVCDIGRSLSVPYAERMFFAGEQACVPFFGYMEGALQSGAKAARDIVSEVCPAVLSSAA